MRILALETSSAAGSVALLCGSEALERGIASPREQTERVLPLVAELLAESGLALPQLDAIAFGRGPGSFTGLRIAAAVTQGLAMSAGLPVVPVSSLAALAQKAWRTHGLEDVLTCVDARMDQLYWGVFRIRAGLAEPRGPERLGGPDSVSVPAAARGRWGAVGSGVGAFREELARVLSGEAVLLPELTPGAADVLPLAAADLAGGGGSAPEAALPVYLRDETAWRRR
jgi:tRNA threonylcarbamoyladenosine biosynthesis protein TsaB